MLNPPEELLQFAWRQKMLLPGDYFTASGRSLRIIHPGELNRDAGPDFFNAQVEIDGTVLAGNVEIHVCATDWLRHGHTNDRSYDNLVLHVVYKNDALLDQNVSHGVEVFEINRWFPSWLSERYEQFGMQAEALPCASLLADVPDPAFLSWLERMGAERLETKSKKVEVLLNDSAGDYAHVFYVLLLSAFGFKVNALPFELIARHLPLRILLRHSDDLAALEALLLGMSGLLDRAAEHGSPAVHQNLFEFLSRKYRLVPLPARLFKFSRMRPASFPSVRLLQFARLVHHRTSLFSNPLEFRDAAALRETLLNPVTGLGAAAADLLLINVFAPLYFQYGRQYARPELQELGVRLLNLARPEKNFKTENFSGKSGLVTTGYHSQGLIHLYDSFCTRRRCLECGIGSAALRRPQLPVAVSEFY